MDTSRLGTISELTAANWLLAQGYDVYKNVMSTGKADLIATKSGEIILIDVKSCSTRQGYDKTIKHLNNINQKLIDTKAALGVRILCVFPNGLVEWGDIIWREYKAKIVLDKLI